MPQFQILGNCGPKWNAMLVDCFCYIQLGFSKLNFIQDPTIHFNSPARIILTFMFYPKTATKNLQGWLSSFTSYHILIFLQRHIDAAFGTTILKVLVDLAKFFSLQREAVDANSYLSFSHPSPPHSISVYSNRSLRASAPCEEGLWNLRAEE